MESQTEYELIDELLALKQAGMPFLDATQEQNPVAHYLDDDRFAAETDALFRALPMIAAHASELPDAGSFLRREIGGRSVLLTRDTDRQIHAFLNVCRHRGTRLVDAEAGCAKRFSCPYHAWTYGSNGALLAAPHFETGFPDSDKTKLGLTRLPVLEKFGFVWVIAAPDSKAQIADYFDGLGAELDALAIDDMVIAEQTNERRKANWKILIEGGIEAYHFKIAHRSTIGPYFEDNLSTYRCFGPHMRSVLARNTVVVWPMRRATHGVCATMPICFTRCSPPQPFWCSKTILSGFRKCRSRPGKPISGWRHWCRKRAGMKKIIGRAIMPSPRPRWTKISRLAKAFSQPWPAEPMSK